MVMRLSLSPIYYIVRTDLEPSDLIINTAVVESVINAVESAEAEASSILSGVTELPGLRSHVRVLGSFTTTVHTTP
jgi:hypothetical protein